jgi:diguanylate cyclase (GGDEF)-like protein
VFYTVVFVALQSAAGLFGDQYSLSLWYLPAGLTLAFLTEVGPRWIPWVFLTIALGGRLTSVYTPDLLAGLPASLMYGAGSLYLRMFTAWRDGDPSPMDVLRFALLAAGTSAFTAIGSVFLLVHSGVMSGASPSVAAFHWWVGDFIGLLTFAPVLILWTAWSRIRTPGALKWPDTWPNRWRRLEPTAQLLVTAITLLAVFLLTQSTHLHFLYLSLIPLLWVALRYPPIITTLWSFGVGLALIVIVRVTHYPVTDLIEVQLLLGTLSVVTLVISTAETKRRDHRADLTFQTLNDPMTQLPNRLGFAQSLTNTCQRALRTGEKVVVGMLDLDGFKRINDTFGHTAGDQLLQLAATRLSAAAGDRILIARMGGDEFSLLMGGVEQVEEAEAAVRVVQHGFETPFLIHGQEIFLRWSIGLSVYPDNTRDQETLLSQADTAMYHAKRAGGGYTFYQRTQEHSSTSDMAMISALHHAIKREELRVYFQPVVHATSHVVVAHEALLRWVRPSGMVSPLDFIQLAEATGLIVPIGRWVLQQSAEALQQRRVKRVSVNVSAIEFQHPEFYGNVQRILEETGINPRHLVLELTESSLLQPERFASVLRDLDLLGVRTALDDFGSGYSSLTALANLPVQLLKIDRDFVAAVGQATPAGQQALEVIRGIVILAGAYGLSTVAEGVETYQQAELLQSVGCTYLQGYLFGRPEPLA